MSQKNVLSTSRKAGERTLLPYFTLSFPKMTIPMLLSVLLLKISPSGH